MAVAYLDRKPVSRGKGQSIIAKAAYNSCSSLLASDGLKDFSKKTGLAYTQIIAQEKKTIDRLSFWTAIEAQEKRKDAQLGYSYEIALPIELTKDQNIRLAEDFTNQIIKRYNFEAADLSIHYPTKRKPHANKKAENPHFHLLTPTRTQTGEKIRLFNNKEDLISIRHIWEETANRHLEEAGYEIKISMENVETQLETINNEIKELETKKTQINLELQQIQEEIDACRTPEAREFHSPRADAVKENDSTREADADIGRGLSGSDKGHEPGIRPTRSTAREGRSPDNQAAARLDRRARKQDKSARKANPHILKRLAQRIASRLDGLRYNRQQYCQTHQITLLFKKLSSRLDGARYARTSQYLQQQKENSLYKPFN